MIKHLDGIHETIDYPAEDTRICLYYNCENEDYPTHWHNTFEIIMPVVNTYRVTCGGEDYSLREGDILIISPCVLHELYAPPTGERIIFQPSFPQLNLKELNRLVTEIRPAMLVTPETHPEAYEDVRRLLVEIKEEYFRAEAYSETFIYSKFLEMLVQIGREQSTIKQNRTNEAGSPLQQEYMEKFMFITDYIDTHFAEDLSLEMLASIAGFSKYYFAKLFRQYTDTTFYKYLTRRRIEHAEEVLIESQASVTEIALQCGFPSLSSFLRMFKQLTKCTPTEFRNMYNDN